MLLNKTQWEHIGLTAGWLKVSENLSSRDVKYINAIKNGDNGTAQKLVDQAADEAIQKEFDYHFTGNIREDAYERYEKPGGLSWLGKKSKYPILLFEKNGIEYRQSGEKLKYTYFDEETLTHRRDEHGELIYRPDEELLKDGYALYDTTVVAFAGETPVGHVSDEFGAVGVWVESPYQKKGIGTTLLDAHMKQRRKNTKIGQMTNAGKNMTWAWLKKKQDRSLVLYNSNGEIIPLSERFKARDYSQR